MYLVACIGMHELVFMFSGSCFRCGSFLVVGVVCWVCVGCGVRCGWGVEQGGVRGVCGWGGGCAVGLCGV